VKCEEGKVRIIKKTRLGRSFCSGGKGSIKHADSTSRWRGETTNYRLSFNKVSSYQKKGRNSRGSQPSSKEKKKEKYLSAMSEKARKT